MRSWACACIFIFVPSVVATVNFSQCLQEVRNGDWGTTGGTDNSGNPVSNISDATGISYSLCLRACGSGSEAFNWNIFSQQFTAWLLPYLALVSQLPFGAKTRLDNLVSMLLTVGSPTLAAYSLALTVLNANWIAQRFSHLSYPNLRNAVRILSTLQQSSLHVDTDDSLLASLILLPENDDWWEELAIGLNYGETWSISAVASIVWVVIAYLFTVVDFFTGGMSYSTLNANGQAVAWLQISPKCDYMRVQDAIRKANVIAYVATADGQPTLASNLSSKRAISLRKGAGEIHCDEQCTAPIFNYARFLPWTLAVEDVYYAFREASQKSESHQPVNSQSAWEKGDKKTRVPHANRRGSLPQVVAYVEPLVKTLEFDSDGPGTRRRRWGPGAVSRFLLASLLALGLTWGTIGAAIVMAYFTPTDGISCRAGSYLIYGVNATIVWILLVTSSGLAHYSTFTRTYNDRYLHTQSTRLAGVISIVLRRTGKVLAALNATWIVLVCLLQFSSFFSRCWCNSSVFSLGKSAYNVIEILPENLTGLDLPWISGVGMASFEPNCSSTASKAWPVAAAPLRNYHLDFTETRFA
ncbi:hypothetical protein C8R44DRAFT_837667 [Mycena epipterygia]|nr:hypothetical protein C8R44DRAFT_837667 [Mycena epipterygia]